jgi:glycosyltransferase involved in cell wall biosynthesis
MRILQVVSALDVKNGGPPRVVVGIACELAKRGHTLAIAIRGSDHDRELAFQAWPALEKHGVELLNFAGSGPEMLFQSTAFRKFLKSGHFKFDVVHFHGIWEFMMSSGGRALRRRQIPYFISAHGALTKWARKSSSLKKRIALDLLGTRSFLNHSSGLIYGTSSEFDEASDLQLRAKALIVPNGIDSAAHALDKRACKERVHALFPQMAEWQTTLLFFGRIHPKKGVDLLVEAAARIFKSRPKVGLLIAGIAEDQAFELQISKFISDNKMGNQVVLTTALTGEAARDALGVADLFVLPSHSEGFSIAIIEALVLGLPVLVSDKCNMNELGDTKAGLICKVDSLDLEEKLRIALSLSKLELEEMGERGRKLAVQKYDWEVVGDQLLAIYGGV